MRVTVRMLDRQIHRIRGSTLGEALFVLVVAAAVARFALHVGAALSVLPGQDFPAFVSNAEAWQVGEPYRDDRDANPPHVMLLFVPFTAMPLSVGIAIWMVCSVAAACATVVLIRRQTGLRLPSNVALVALALFLVAPATTEMVVNANMIWVMWLPFTAAWLLARRNHPFASGAVLGVLVSAKPFLALWFPYFLLRRHWRALAGATVGIGAAFVIGVAMTGTTAWNAWLLALQRIPWHDLPYNTSAAGVLARISALEPGTWLAASAPFVAVCWYRLARCAPDTDWEWSLLLLTALAIGPLGWRYYHTWLIGPLALWLAARPPTRTVAAVLLVTVFTPTWWTSERSVLFAVSLGSTAFWTATATWLVVAMGQEREPGGAPRKAFS
jgi:hypothetical protein